MNIEFCKECADFNKCTHKEKDCPYFEEEQAELNEKASKMPRNYEKVKLVQDNVVFLQKNYNISVEKEN